MPKGKECCSAEPAHDEAVSRSGCGAFRMGSGPFVRCNSSDALFSLRSPEHRDMALTKRIIPCLDVDRGRVVKGVNFLQLRDAGDPVEVARRYEEEGADELVFLDISASHEGRQILLEVVRRVSEQIFMPFTVGGGIRSLDDATRLIQAGAEKVSINSAAVKTPELISEVAGKFGRCATVVNIDPRRVRRDGREVWEVHVNGD